MENLPHQFKKALDADDVGVVSRLLESNPEVREHLDSGMPPAGVPALAGAKSRAMVDLLMSHGARLEAVGKWWSSGFGASHVPLDTAEYLVECGAEISIHAATAVGLTGVVRKILEAAPAAVVQRGGDGAHPLHFCARLEIARMLVEAGAEIDARDEDHNSTPVQWRIGDAPEVVRFLIENGATPDIFIAVALDDLDLVKELVNANPECTTNRIGNNSGDFPGIGFKGLGGSIYQWTLGFNQSPHGIARKRGHCQIFEFLFERTPPLHQLLVAATLGDRVLAEDVHSRYPGLVAHLDEDDLQLLAKYCWETSKDIEAVRLMLDLGFPVDVPEVNHGFMALHNAAWCGDPELVALLLERGHPVDRVDPNYQSNAIGWAIHSCLEAKRHPNGRFSEVVGLLLAAGTPFDQKHYPVGHAEIDAVLRAHLKL